MKRSQHTGPPISLPDPLKWSINTVRHADVAVRLMLPNYECTSLEQIDYEPIILHY